MCVVCVVCVCVVVVVVVCVCVCVCVCVSQSLSAYSMPLLCSNNGVSKECAAWVLEQLSNFHVVDIYLDGGV